jgi:hypothetical protein
MAVIRSRDEGSLTTGGGGFQSTPLPERSFAGLDIDLAREAGAAQVKDEVLVDTPRSDHLVGQGQVDVSCGDPG